MPALAESQEQSEQRGTHDQPGRYLHVDDRSPAYHPQDEAGADYKNVEQDDTLQYPRIERVDDAIHQQDDEEGAVEAPRPIQGEDGEYDRHHCGGSHAQFPRSQRPQSLQRMFPVLRRVKDVIQKVNGAGNHAEQDRAPRYTRVAMPIGEAARKDQGGKNEAVFNPLLRTEAAHEPAKSEVACWGGGLWKSN